jgi:hypothetical protein
MILIESALIFTYGFVGNVRVDGEGVICSMS